MHFGVVGTQSQRGPVAGDRPCRIANTAVCRAEQ